MVYLALAITAISVAITAINVFTARRTERSLREHEEACRKIREDIAHMPLASVEMDALRSIDKHIAAIRETARKMQSLEEHKRCKHGK